MERWCFKGLYRQARWLIAALLAFSAVVKIERNFEKDQTFCEIALAVDRLKWHFHDAS
jgi:hypothetical protein